MIGYLKLPYANPKKGAKRSIIHRCRNVVLGRKTAKVHHYMLYCSQFIMWRGEADGIFIHLEHYPKKKEEEEKHH